MASSMVCRLVVFGLVVSGVWLMESAYDARVQPDVSATAAVSALNGGSAEADAVRSEHASHNLVPATALGVTAAAAVLCFAPRRRACNPWLRR